MGEAEHTPGPLHVIEPADESLSYGIVDNDMQMVAYVGIKGRPNAANARLYAASPELLEAGRDALRWIALNTPLADSTDPIFGAIADEADAIRDRLRLAIDKATSRRARATSPQPEPANG